MSQASGNIGSLQVFNKEQTTISEKNEDTQKLHTYIDRKSPDDQDYVSIFSRVICHELSHDSRSDLYSRCWMDFVRTEATHFVELGIPDVNTLDEVNILGTPATRIKSPTYESHWSVPDHVFFKTTAVRMSATRSQQD